MSRLIVREGCSITQVLWLYSWRKRKSEGEEGKITKKTKQNFLQS